MIFKILVAKRINASDMGDYIALSAVTEPEYHAEPTILHDAMDEEIASKSWAAVKVIDVEVEDQAFMQAFEKAPIQGKIKDAAEWARILREDAANG